VASRPIDAKALAGKLPEPERRVQLLIVGAGAAGCAAAVEAATAGARVLLIDENPVDAGLMGLDAPLYYGGRYTAAVQAKARMLEQVFSAEPGLEAAMEAGAEVELGVYAWGAWIPGEGLAALPGAVAGLADEHRSWMVGFDKLIVAAGARDTAFAFKGWDQPGVMGARAFRALLQTYNAFAGRRVAILGSGPLALDTIRLAHDAGVDVVAVIEVADSVQAAGLATGLATGMDVRVACVPLVAHGDHEGVTALTVRDTRTGENFVIACDTIIQAISLTPTVELLDVLGAAIAPLSCAGGHAPASTDGARTSLPDVFIAGDVAGAPGGSWLAREAAQASGRRAARRALGLEVEPAPEASSDFDALAYQALWARVLFGAADPSLIICQCESVSLEALLAARQPDYLGPPPPAMARRDLGELLRDGPVNQDQIKRLTRACMGACQARRCREQVALALAGAANIPPADVPLAGYRAPVRPLPLSVIADWRETPEMAAGWDVWFGIRGQWTPYADIGTEREALYDGLFGGDMHL